MPRKSNSCGDFPIRLENEPSAGVRAAFFDGVCRDVGMSGCRIAAVRRLDCGEEAVRGVSGSGDAKERAGR